MAHFSTFKHVLPTVAMLLAMVVAGCQRGDPQPSEPQTPPTDEAAAPEVEPEGEPVVEPVLEPAVEPAAEPEMWPAIEPEPQPDVEPEGERRDEPEGEPGLTVQPDPEVEAVEEPPVIEPLEEPTIEALEQPEAEPPRDLGPPLVDNAEKLKRLDPVKPVWLDTDNRRVVMVGQICQREAGLELFACLKDTKEHESIVTVDVEAFKVHAGLLASGAMVGHPVRFDPMYMPATGTEIEITIVWKNEKGQRQTARAQDWVLDVETDEAMTHPWVFAGSGFWVDEQTGTKYYQAEGGDFICVSNFSSAMLDLPIESSQANSALMYHAFTEKIPPLGTPVTLILTPRADDDEEAVPETKEDDRPPSDPPADPAAESEAEGESEEAAALKEDNPAE